VSGPTQVPPQRTRDGLRGDQRRGRERPGAKGCVRTGEGVLGVVAVRGDAGLGPTLTSPFSKKMGRERQLER
jgi:hypothetical protein